MAKRNSTNMSKRIKTRHKKTNKGRRAIAGQRIINPAIKDINKAISNQTKIKHVANAEPNVSNQPIELQAMSLQSFRKLTGSDQKKQKVGKLSVDDGLYLEKLLKRWGTNYARMAQDIKLNRMQWTAQQIQKKHKTYNKIFKEQENTPAS